jgi:DNA-binding protein YbaB
MEQPSFQLPSDAALQGVLDELNKALKEVPDTQRRLMSLTGVAWSGDGMVKAEVGPRGQLIDLEIDQRVFRRPDAHALKSSIMEAVAAAVGKVSEQTQEIILGQVPPEVAELRAQFRPAGDDPMFQMLRTDAEIVAERRRTDGDLR